MWAGHSSCQYLALIFPAIWQTALRLTRHGGRDLLTLSGDYDTGGGGGGNDDNDDNDDQGDYHQPTFYRTTQCRPVELKIK